MDFYTRTDVVSVARELIGKVLYTRMNGALTGAMITEAEAYAGVTDRASHAYADRRTSRTEIMYREGGCAYVYLCYGVHSLFNIVTGQLNQPHAVLIRGARILTGAKHAATRLGCEKVIEDPISGPGKISKALGIHFSMTGTSLLGDVIWLEDHGIHIPDHRIKTGPRIGVEYAGDDALLPYRFLLQDIDLKYKDD